MGGSAFRRGREGEAHATRYLEARGWEVVARNWRDGPRELDLVVRSGDVLAFVEVKTRARGTWGHPLEALTWRKRNEVERAARAWLRAWLEGRPGTAGPDTARPGTTRPGTARPGTIRFDVIVVRIGGGGPPDVEHVPDAWRSGWGGG